MNLLFSVSTLMRFLFSEMYTDCGKVYFGNCNFSAHTSFSVLTFFAQKKRARNY